MSLSRPQFLPYWVKKLRRSLNELMFAELRPVPGAHRYCTSVSEVCPQDRCARPSGEVPDVTVVAQHHDQEEDQEQGHSPASASPVLNG